jgi:phosphatidylserine decarboxylase
MEVGAMGVGSIVQTATANSEVQAGDEKGYFKFGGSTTLFFLEKGRILFDEVLVRNSESGIETLVRMGESIGRKIEPSDPESILPGV